ncbi:hypothetical protein BKA67DRAFT_529533 [Truncatella angustata]|uniref:Ergosterol biosynthetic protein 28 n=1 Tax=Truncatella angustata TaxID=152316 RepID=A0A9P8UW10_9PEZI|nr:uncharacterized protein BKA67DRAFT_529533 [Truncatella angustata]KAH6659380.1 hypothetical protein BKA67DRAFT_529533 [Truncatella angustata]KAH8205610.1 hypothetical protein TruAng_000316 [Truncatella angustata]
MDALKEWIPSSDGYLPYYMFGLSILAVGNSLQNYLTLHYSRRLYNGQFIANPSLPPKTSTYNPEDATNKIIPAGSAKVKPGSTTFDQCTPLAARLFGTYTLISAIVRLYASYHLDKEPVYMIALWTYLVALGHFGSEIFVFKSAYLFGPEILPQLFPLCFATIGTIWMIAQKSFYVQV